MTVNWLKKMITKFSALIFKNPDLQHSITENGFVVIDANLNREVDQLHAYISNHFKFPSSNFYYSLLENSFEQNKRLQSIFKEILGDFYETHFSDYRTRTESFLAKPRNTNEELLLHQDWCYTDEKNHIAYNIWIPLQDVTQTNGAMFFLPGSHLWFNNLRSGSLLTGRIRTLDLPKHQIQAIPLKKGQAIIFHPAVFHGSYPNFSNQNRLIATATLFQKDSPFLYYHQSETKNEVSVFRLADDAFLKELPILAIGGKPDCVETYRQNYNHHIITANELNSKLATFVTK